eukprot:75678_1
MSKLLSELKAKTTMSNISTNKSDDLNRNNQNYICISRLVLFYTFFGVTYLLVRSSPQCSCELLTNISTKQLLSTNTLLPTETDINVDNPVIPSRGSTRNLLATNSTIRSVKRNYEAIQNLYSMLPNGIILLWYGSISTIPPGWNLCNGSNGTPDLRDKFVIGGGNTYRIDDTGGSFDITLTNNDIPKHTHNLSPSNVASSIQNSHNHARGTFSLSTQSAHTHTFSTISDGAGSHLHSFSVTTTNEPNHRHTFSDKSTGNGNHNHYINFDTSSNNHGRHNHEMTNVLESDSYKPPPVGGTVQGVAYIPGIGIGLPTSNGGEHEHSVSGNTDDAASHTHDVSGDTGYSGSHTHDVSGNTGTILDHKHSTSGTTDSSTSHTHTISGSSANNGAHSHTVSGVTEPVGNGNTINILNPYYTAY